MNFMIDFWRSAIRQQFHAAIDMLGNAIEACPDSVWSGKERGAFWYLAFHTIFFLDLYLSAEGESGSIRPHRSVSANWSLRSSYRSPPTGKKNCSATSSTAARSWTP